MRFLAGPACWGGEEALRSIESRKGGRRFVPKRLIDRTRLASYIDHTLLDPRATPEDVARMAREARKFQVAGLCVNSGYAAWARQIGRAHV